jgi:hypothetical protein
MINAIERFGDRLLSVVMPRVTASANPGGSLGYAFEIGEGL